MRMMWRCGSREVHVKLMAVHTCPVWQEPDGARTIGMERRENPPPVVGWCNVLSIRIARRRYLLLAVDVETR